RDASLCEWIYSERFAVYGGGGLHRETPRLIWDVQTGEKGQPLFATCPSTLRYPVESSPELRASELRSARVCRCRPARADIWWVDSAQHGHSVSGTHAS